MKAAVPLVFCAALLSTALPADAAGRRLTDDERTAIYVANAGAAVDSIPFFGSYSGWTPLDDAHLALWTGPSKAYLIEVYGPCMGLDYASNIRLDNRIGRLTAKFDRIYASGVGITPVGCQIKEIRPLDIKAVRAAEKEARLKPKPLKPQSGQPQAGSPQSDPPSGT